MANYGIYEGIEKLLNETGGKVVADLAFNLGNRDFLIKSSQQEPMDRHALLINREATSVWQLREWAMCMIQGLFPRLKDPLYYEEECDRMVILQLMVHL